MMTSPNSLYRRCELRKLYRYYLRFSEPARARAELVWWVERGTGGLVVR